MRWDATLGHNLWVRYHKTTKLSGYKATRQPTTCSAVFGICRELRVESRPYVDYVERGTFVAASDSAKWQYHFVREFIDLYVCVCVRCDHCWLTQFAVLFMFIVDLNERKTILICPRSFTSIVLSVLSVRSEEHVITNASGLEINNPQSTIDNGYKTKASHKIISILKVKTGL